MVYTCRIKLDGITPEIWREFQFDPDITFDQLHNIIQFVMGWEDDHLYEFHVHQQVIGLPDPVFGDPGDRPFLNARRETVKKHVHKKKTVFTYVYDFGDDWNHTITLMDIDLTVSDSMPLCLNGARSCPPEDVGGVWGYQHLTEVLQTPDHPERDDLLNWVSEDYDPESFSCEAVNGELQRFKDKLIPKVKTKKPEGKTPVKLTKTALNKHLKQLSHDQLVDLVKACFSVSKDMERYLAVKILGDEAVESLFQEYRKKVEQEFFPEHGDGKLRLKAAKNAISEFGKLTGDVKRSLELKLIYVENGVRFTLTYGDMDERFYNSMESVYADIINQVNKDETGELFEEFEERLEAIVWDTREVGWGFHENLAEIHGQL